MMPLLTIYIAKRPTVANYAGRCAGMINAIMAGPYINHRFIGGGWIVDLPLMMVSFVMVAALANHVFDPRTKHFDTAEEAAEWVRTWRE